MRTGGPHVGGKNRFTGPETQRGENVPGIGAAISRNPNGSNPEARVGRDRIDGAACRIAGSGHVSTREQCRGENDKKNAGREPHCRMAHREAGAKTAPGARESIGRAAPPPDSHRRARTSG